MENVFKTATDNLLAHKTKLESELAYVRKVIAMLERAARADRLTLSKSHHSKRRRYWFTGMSKAKLRQEMRRRVKKGKRNGNSKH